MKGGNSVAGRMARLTGASALMAAISALDGAQIQAKAKTEIRDLFPGFGWKMTRMRDRATLPARLSKRGRNRERMARASRQHNRRRAKGKA